MSQQVTSTFWTSLKQSGLLDPAEFASLRRDPQTAALSADEAARLLVEQGRITEFQAERLLQGRSRGFVFDRFQITDVLGVGGMGSVYQAKETATGKVVALKVLQEQLNRDDGLRARFLQEANIGLKLTHPHIIRTYELGSAGGLPYMIMELVPGPSLFEILLRVKRLPWAAACEFARQAALGLHYAHQQGFIHRDVKPQNLLVDAMGQVRLLDFGLAMTCEGEGGDEFSMAMIFGHQCVGTAEYTAPEQTSDSLAADARSDIYSLGATLFTALTGRTPFQADTTDQMLQAHRVQRLRSVRDFVPSIPEGVAEIVTKMLARDPAERYATAEEVALALAEWAKPVPVEFSFDAILAERKIEARRKYAQLSHKSRPSAPSMAHSTARPTKESSVAQISKSRSGASKISTSKVSTSKISYSGPQAPVAPTDDSSTALPPLPAEPLGVFQSLQTDEKFPLTLDRLVIGRSAECQLHVDDPAVSSRHCELRYDGFHWWLADLGSRNGTSVNGVPVRHHQLRSGDEVTIGTRVRFRLQYGPDEQPPPPVTRSQRTLWLAALAMAIVAALIATAVWWLRSGV